MEIKSKIQKIYVIIRQVTIQYFYFSFIKKNKYLFIRKKMNIISVGWGAFLATVTFSIALVIWGRNGFQ